MIIYDKLQHEMYWNNIKEMLIMIRSTINYNMRCIETKNYYGKDKRGFMINYNMRCIETWMTYRF